MLLQVVPNAAFRREIEANASPVNINPETWVSIAISMFIDATCRVGPGYQN
jgi:hypothetical protein